jgi:hypothetical protein
MRVKPPLAVPTVLLGPHYRPQVAAGGEEHPYADYGQRAMNGWHQIFCYDPEGNVIEVHQDMNA